LNVTAPVGIPPVLVTAAVNLTDCPIVMGFDEEAIVVVVGVGGLCAPAGLAQAAATHRATIQRSERNDIECRILE
jgi:hypothetical protein